MNLQFADIEMPTADCKCWYIDTAKFSRVDAEKLARRFLTDLEFATGRKKPTDSARLEYWSARLLVRHALTLFCGGAVAPGDWVLRKKRSGKTVVQPVEGCPEKLEFSITHTDGIVVCAVRSGGNIGIDVESLSRQINPVLINNRLFSKRELRMISTVSADARNAATLELWNLKEACSKTLGLGLAADFSKISFSQSQAGSYTLDVSDTLPHADRWETTRHNFMHRYTLAVVADDSSKERQLG